MNQQHDSAKNDNHKQKMEYTQIVVDKNIKHPPNHLNIICAQKINLNLILFLSPYCRKFFIHDYVKYVSICNIVK